MIYPQQKRVALHVRAKNSYALIAKTIELRWTKVPSLSDPLGPSLESTALRKAQGRRQEAGGGKQNGEGRRHPQITQITQTKMSGQEQEEEQEAGGKLFLMLPPLFLNRS